MGLCIGRIGGKPSSCFPASVSGKDEVPEDSSCDGLRLLPVRVTLQSCLYAPADSVSATEHAAVARADAYSALNEGLSEDDVTRAEARLGRALPDRLIALYREQNGGAVAALCIPRPGQKAPTRPEQVILPSGGFNDLLPAGRLRTVWETVTDCAAPAPPGVASQVPDRAKGMIVLAGWCRQALFLGYNQPGAPQAGYADFDGYDTDANRDTVTGWKDFEAFFAALRHYEPA